MQNGNGNRLDGMDEASQATQRAADRFKTLADNLKKHTEELKDYGKYYLTAKADGYKALGKKIAIFAVLGIVGGIALATFLVMCVAMLCIGIANAITVAIGSAWAGWMIAGGGMLLCTLLFLAIGVLIAMGAMKRATFSKYEKMLKEQQRKHGRNVHIRAVEHAAEHGI